MDKIDFLIEIPEIGAISYLSIRRITEIGDDTTFQIITDTEVLLLCGQNLENLKKERQKLLEDWENIISLSMFKTPLQET